MSKLKREVQIKLNNEDLNLLGEVFRDSLEVNRESKDPTLERDIQKLYLKIYFESGSKMDLMDIISTIAISKTKRER